MSDEPEHAGSYAEGWLSDKERELARELEHRRPVPRSAFRAALGRRLASLDPGYGHRPAHLRLLVVTWVTAGVTLLLIALGVSTGLL
jgi:hypothetical protein